jgi:hypothetical protein
VELDPRYSPLTDNAQLGQCCEVAGVYTAGQQLSLPLHVSGIGCGWLKAGTLAADKRGGRFLIDRSVLEPLIGQSNGHERAAAAERTPPDTDAAASMLELVRLVGRLQEENRNLADQLGYVQSKLQEAQLALAAPNIGATLQNGDSPEIATGSPQTTMPQSRPRRRTRDGEADALVGFLARVSGPTFSVHERGEESARQVRGIRPSTYFPPRLRHAALHSRR